MSERNSRGKEKLPNSDEDRRPIASHPESRCNVVNGSVRELKMSRPSYLERVGRQA